MRSSTIKWTVSATFVAALFAVLALTSAGQAQISGCDTIDSSGTWTLDASFTTNASSDCLVVQADDVELVGNDHTINGTDAADGVQGIRVDGASNVTIGNLSVASFPADGLHLASSDNVTVDNVTTNHHGGSGATLDTVDDTRVQASTVSHNTDHGLNLTGTNQDDRVYGTEIASNGQAGVFVSNDTGGLEAVDNRFDNANNTEFEASPLGNAWNAPASEDENVLGYTAYGGNYWATPAGDGYSQTCADANQDGYCDSKNTLASNNEDGTPLAPLGTLEGTVTDSAGDPVDGVTVDVFDQVAGTGKSTTTDAQGRYSFELPPGTYGLDIRPSDYGSFFAKGLEVTFEGTTTKDAQLAGTGTLDVTVQDSNGTGIENASLEVFDDGKTTFQSTTTNASGTASLDVAEATYTVVADKSGYGQVVDQGNDVTADQTTSLTLTLQDGSHINGTVDDSNGNGVQGATVVADDGSRFTFSQTDSNGDYSLEVGAGTYNVMVFHQPQNGEPSYARADGEITLGADEETQVNMTLVQPTVTGENVRIVDGPGDESSIDVDVSVMQGLLGVRLWNPDQGQPGLPYDLAAENVNASTEFEINFTVEGYDPAALLWGGANASWSTSPNATNANATDVSIRATPVHLAGIDQEGLPVGPMMGQNAETVSWPTGSSDKADAAYDWQHTVFLSLFDLSTLPSERTDLLRNMTVTTNAQGFTIPQVKDGRLSVWVGGPATDANGNNHDGFYRAFVPDAQLDDWGISDPASELSALYKGDSASFSVNETDTGAWINMDINYSSGSVDIEPEATSSPSSGGGGSRAPVSEGDTATRRTGSTFTAEAGATIVVDRGLPDGVDEAEVSFAQECQRCEIEVTGHEDRPEAAPGLPSGYADVRYLTMDVRDSSADAVEGAVAEGEVRFTVDTDELAVQPSQVVLLHAEEGWEALPTRVADADAEPPVYTATLDGFSAFAVTTDEQPPELVDPFPSPGASASWLRTVAATIEDNRGLAEGGLELRLDGQLLAPERTGDRFTYQAEQPLAPGGHTVEVAAEDASGHDLERSWSFHVPCQRTPTLHDAEGGPGEVTITVAAGSCEVADAEATVGDRRLGDWFEPVPAGQTRSFTTAIPDGVEAASETQLEVTLTDEAGGETTGVDAVATQSTDGADAETSEPSRTPGPGLLGLLAALGLTSLARTRRR